MTEEGASKIRVLVVDDSVMLREVIAKGITMDPRIEVIAKAADAFEARDMIIRFRPDVMTCDIQMPKLNGIEFIKRLLPQYSLPVIVVSTVSEAVFDAMEAGAVEFVTKPGVGSGKNMEGFIQELIYKIKVASVARLINKKESEVRQVFHKSFTDSRKIIAIGASTGGTEAIFSVLKALPKNMPGIVIVQHIPPVFSRMFAERLNKQTGLHVKEAETGDWVEQGKVLLAPGDYQMIIKKIGDKYKVECFIGEKVNGHSPSVDVLFDSVAKEAGNQAVGVILTGMGCDGAKGLLKMRNKGARTIGQDEKSSVVYGMPKTAFNIGAVEKQVDLNEVPDMISVMLQSLSK